MRRPRMRRPAAMCAAMVFLVSGCLDRSGDSGEAPPPPTDGSASAAASGSGGGESAARWIDTLLTVIRQERLTTLAPECLSFDSEPVPDLLSFTVREKHSPSCGGDPETAPRLFSISIDTITDIVRSDARSADGSMETIRVAGMGKRE